MGAALGRGGRLPAGSPEAARAARSGAAARAPPPSASHPQAPLGPGPARSLAAEPSASAPGGAYKAARQLRPGYHWPPSPRPRAYWLSLTAPPLPSTGPINTARPAPRSPRLGGRSHRPRLAIGRPLGTRRRLPTCPVTGSVLIAGCARQLRGCNQPDGARARIDKGASDRPTTARGQENIGLQDQPQARTGRDGCQSRPESRPGYQAAAEYVRLSTASASCLKASKRGFETQSRKLGSTFSNSHNQEIAKITCTESWRSKTQTASASASISPFSPNTQKFQVHFCHNPQNFAKAFG